MANEGAKCFICGRAIEGGDDAHHSAGDIKCKECTNCKDPFHCRHCQNAIDPSDGEVIGECTACTHLHCCSRCSKYDEEVGELTRIDDYNNYECNACIAVTPEQREQQREVAYLEVEVQARTAKRKERAAEYESKHDKGEEEDDEQRVSIKKQKKQRQQAPTYALLEMTSSILSKMLPTMILASRFKDPEAVARYWWKKYGEKEEPDDGAKFENFSQAQLEVKMAAMDFYIVLEEPCADNM